MHAILTTEALSATAFWFSHLHPPNRSQDIKRALHYLQKPLHLQSNQLRHMKSLYDQFLQDPGQFTKNFEPESFKMTTSKSSTSTYVAAYGSPVVGLDSETH